MNLKFAKVYLDVQQRYWQNILWTDETTVELFGRNTQHSVEEKPHQDILQENVRLSVRQLKLKRRWVMQQDNDPKHISKSSTEEYTPSGVAQS